MVEDGINATDISAVATSDRAQSLADGSSTALSAALGAGMIGLSGDINDSTITTTVDAGAADSTGDGEEVAFESSALSLGVGAGYLGTMGDLTQSEAGSSDVTSNVTSAAANADARHFAFASSSALSMGIGGIESIELIFESLSELAFLVDGISLDLFDGLPGLDLLEGDPIGPEFGLGALAGSISASATASDPSAVLINDILDDPIEGEPGDAEGAVASASADAFAVASSTYGTISADIPAEATAADALADAEDAESTYAVALSEANAIGIVGNLYGETSEEVSDELSGSVVAIATAGSAEALSSNGDATAAADAVAQGTGRVEIALTGSVEATATGGELATATSDDESAYAYADALAYGISGLGANLSGEVTANAYGGTAEATANDDGSAEAGAQAEAIAIYGSVGNQVPERGEIEGGELEEYSPIIISGDLTAYAEGGESTASSDDSDDEDDTLADSSAYAYGVLIENEEDGNIEVDQFSGTITATALAGSADADSTDEDTDSSAYAAADATAAGFSDVVRFAGDLNGIIDAAATAGNANAYSDDEDAFADAAAAAYAVEFEDFEEEYGTFLGDVGGETTLLATGGVSEASSQGEDAGAFSDARTAVLEDVTVFEGEFGGVHDLTSIAGQAYAVSDEYEASAYADSYARAYAINMQVEDSADFIGDYTATVVAVAQAGGAAGEGVIETEVETGAWADAIDFAIADAAATASGLDDVALFEGNFEGDVDIAALGGYSDAEAEFEEADADSTAEAYGVSFATDLDGNSEFIGDVSSSAVMNIRAVAGESDAEVGNDEVWDATGYAYAYADSTAHAAAIGRLEYFTGNYAANTTVEAQGGDATATATAYEGDSDTIDAGASAEANAYAFGIELSDNFGSPEIGDDPIEGLGFMGAPITASAFAGGIVGPSVSIGEISGEEGIRATAIAGLVEVRDDELIVFDPIEGEESSEFDFPTDLPELDKEVAELGQAFAAGVMTYARISFSDPIEGIDVEPASILDVVISTHVHTFVQAPEGFEEALDEDNSYAAAVYSGQSDDYVELAEGADIIGDINTGGGSNELVVTGNTIMEGNILSSSIEWVDNMLSISNGSGLVDFNIDAGLFTAVRTVNVSDLANALEIAATGGLSPILVQADDEMALNQNVTTSLLRITGDNAGVNIAEGAIMLPVFDESIVLDGLVGNAYTIIDTTGAIVDGGAIADGSLTPYNFSTNLIEDQGNQYQLVVDSLRVLDEEETPGNVQGSQAIASASQAIMMDMNKHGGMLRGMLRRNAQTASLDAIPAGAAGPDAADVAYAERMRHGEWLGYTSVFGNIGEQDDDAGFAGYEYDTYGFSAGFEKLFNDQLILGIAGSYAKTDVDGGSGSGGGDSELYSGAVYANWFSDTWFFNGGLTYGQASSDVYRIGPIAPGPVVGVLTGDYDSEMIGTWFEVGYTHKSGSFSIEPYGRVTYVSGSHDGYTENNAAAAPGFEQIVDDDDTDNLKTEIGVRLGHEWTYDNGSSFLLEGKVGWEHEWADNFVEVDATYLGDRITLQSGEADEAAAVFGLRAQWQAGNGIAVGVEYEPTFAGNWYNHAFSGTLQYNW